MHIFVVVLWYVAAAGLRAVDAVFEVVHRYHRRLCVLLVVVLPFVLVVGRDWACMSMFMVRCVIVIVARCLRAGLHDVEVVDRCPR